jgi:hypothetical protein
MLGHTFYHNTIRRYVILFGTLFNDIHINREDTSNGVTRTIKVPISYGPKEKMLARLDADPSLNRPAIVLPRMSFELTDLNYGPTRKLNTIGKMVGINTNDQTKYQYTPVPYDFNFILSIAVKNADDGTRILEQILPFFTPSWNSTVDLIPELGIKLDIPIILNAVSSEDSYEGNFEERRSIVWTLSFTMKGYIFGPTRPSSSSGLSAGLIKLANINFYDTSTYTNVADAVGNLDVVESVTIAPGMLANGSPTSNSALSVSSDQINANDNYGYIITKS